jgi:hypothetical protein
MFLFYSCKKDIDKPCCEAETEKVPWLLASVLTHHHIGPGVHRFDRHAFYYNSANKLIAHALLGGTMEDLYPLTLRVDSFFYNSQQQIVRIQSKDNRGPHSYRKLFFYAGNRKARSLRYSQDNALLDSTVYRYLNGTVERITYHPGKPAADTAIFVYDQQQNLIRVKIGAYLPDFQELQLYDDVRNPALFLGGLSGLELDPYEKGEWEDEFLIMMQSPRFSRNNYRLRRTAVTEFTYENGVSAPDTVVTTIQSPRYDFEVEQAFYMYFEYLLAN